MTSETLFSWGIGILCFITFIYLWANQIGVYDQKKGFNQRNNSKKNRKNRRK
jgi:hypothetical protein